MQLAHFSVKEYFILHVQVRAISPSITSAQISHTILAQICLAQLLYFNTQSILSWDNSGSVDLKYLDTSFPLAQYATLNWISHYRHAIPAADKATSIDEMVIKFFTSESGGWSYPLQSWVHIQNLIINTDPYHLKYEPDSLYQSQILSRSLWSFTDLETLPLDTSPLYYACFSGSLRAVVHLISHGADVNEVGNEASTRPLLIASEEGHLEQPVQSTL